MNIPELEIENVRPTAKIVAHSVAPSGIEITTFQLRYWRAIHSELMTHRVFSRNASSSRAIPVAKLLEQVRTQPAGPIHWGSNKPGMQAGDELAGEERILAQEAWLGAARAAADHAEALMKQNLHKQVANRLLEPFCFISVVLTTTELSNWLDLRFHPAAQPDINWLARAMIEAKAASTPVPLTHGEWHLPYVNDNERKQYDTNTLLKISTARCARVSYLNHDGTTPNVEKDIALHDTLVSSHPRHASPAEHQATPLERHNGGWSNNFRGWLQYRAVVDGSAVYYR